VLPAATTPVGHPADAATVAPVAAAAARKPAIANLQLISTAEAAALKPAVGKGEARPQLAKASPANKPRSLDRLISEIAEGR
jgi:hypothetical protein